MIRWSMLLSHHAPCDYDHTLRIGKLRFCARCTGILLGALGGTLCLLHIRPLKQVIPFWGLFFLPLPGVADFCLHELGCWRSCNGARLLSGGLLGAAIGWGLCTIPSKGGLIFAWLAFLELLAALVLKVGGRLDGFLQKYEAGCTCDDLRADRTIRSSCGSRGAR